MSSLKAPATRLSAGATFNLQEWLKDKNIFPTTSYDPQSKEHTFTYDNEEAFKKIVYDIRDLCTTWGFELQELAV